MTDSSTEIDRLFGGVTVWHRYVAAVKADLFASLLTAGSSGAWVLDPIAIESPALLGLTSDQQINGIVVTNANHVRDAAAFSARLSAPIYASAEAEIPGAIPIADKEQLTPDLTVLAIEGAAPGEIALFWKGGGGTLVMGDALINFGSDGFTFLPAKYCSNQKVMRKSLRKLLEFPFERILFAHGVPIVTKARERFAALLETAG